MLQFQITCKLMFNCDDDCYLDDVIFNNIHLLFFAAWRLIFSPVVRQADCTLPTLTGRILEIIHVHLRKLHQPPLQCMYWMVSLSLIIYSKLYSIQDQLYIGKIVIPLDLVPRKETFWKTAILNSGKKLRNFENNFLQFLC